MPVAIPQTVRRSLGDEAAVDFLPWMEEWLSESIREKAVPRDEYGEVLSRLGGLEKDISLVKEELTKTRAELRDDQARMRAGFREEQGQMRAELREDQAQMRAELRQEMGQLRQEMNERFAHVEERFDRVNEHFDRVHERFDQMNQRFESRLDQMSERMLVQTRWLIGSIALFGTILTILMAIAQFTP